MNVLLPEEKPPVITKFGNAWLFVSANTLLYSSSKTDKEYMLRELKKWSKRNV